MEGGLDPAILDFTASLEVDRRLLRFDLEASAVHVRMLARQGLIDPGLATTILDSLAGVELEPDAADEDVHSAIERLLGDLGPWVHAGRSRNDQVQTAMRMWVKDACRRTAGAARTLGEGLADRAASDGSAVMPGYTHGQRAQPIWLGQHLAAHAWALSRDIARFAAVWAAADICPSGPARWRVRACRSIPTGWPPSWASAAGSRTPSTRCPTGTT